MSRFSVGCQMTGCHLDPGEEYQANVRMAKKWAAYALQNRREGLPWQDCARLAHEYLSWALLIIR